MPQDAIYLRLHPDLIHLGWQNREEKLVIQHHKTRLLITLDSPHQGANVPLSVQYFYNRALHLMQGTVLLTMLTNMGLQSYAAKQMLLYHIDSNPAFVSSLPLPNQPYHYTSDPAHTIFYAQLKSMGNYPKFCKIDALTNGSLEGRNQLNYFGNERVPNDLLAKFHIKLHAQILWFIHIPIFQWDIILRTNPNGTGTFYSNAMGNFTFHIKLKWFGIDLNYQLGNIYSNNQVAIDVKSYGVHAGGYWGGFNLDAYWPSTEYQLSDNWFFNVFSYQLGHQNNCYFLKSHVGWKGFASLNLDFDLCTDGTRFCFVPIQSAIDYGNGMNIPLNHDIYNENINTKLSRTPFDFIMGYPTLNHGHLFYRDPEVYNITQQPAANCSYLERFTYYDPSQQMNCGIERGVLNMEIGDEEMYLENWDLNRKAEFQAEYAVYVNKRNPYYEYPSFSTTLTKLGIYSKANPFYITNQGHATFISNGADSPTGLGFIYNNPQSSSYWHAFKDSVMPICFEEQNGMITSPNSSTIQAKEQNITVKLNPNPSHGTNINVQYYFPKDNLQTIRVYDLTGKLVYSQNQINKDKGTLFIHLKNLTKGIYIAKFIGKNSRRTKKLIIK